MDEPCPKSISTYKTDEYRVIMVRRFHLAGKLVNGLKLLGTVLLECAAITLVAVFWRLISHYLFGTPLK